MRNDSSLNVYQAAARIGLPPAVIHCLTRGGIIPARRVGPTLRVEERALLNWARSWGRVLAVFCSEGRR